MHFSVSATATKQSEARERVLALIDTLAIGDAIPSERQLSAERCERAREHQPRRAYGH